jgi:hypothetical protein
MNIVSGRIILQCLNEIDLIVKFNGYADTVCLDTDFDSHFDEKYKLNLGILRMDDITFDTFNPWQSPD